MEVGKLIKKYLIENSFDGLYHPSGKCACKLEALYICMPYGFSPKCKPGILVITENDKRDGSFTIFERKDK